MIFIIPVLMGLYFAVVSVNILVLLICMISQFAGLILCVKNKLVFVTCNIKFGNLIIFVRF
jgi:hypothetical protein